MAHRHPLHVPHALVLLTTLLPVGCASPISPGRAVAGVGALTVAAGLLVAGGCTRSGRREPSGALCSGNPDSEDLAEGAGIVAAGGAVLAAGIALEQSSHPARAPAAPSGRFPEVRGPRRSSAEE